MALEDKFDTLIDVVRQGFAALGTPQVVLQPSAPILAPAPEQPAATANGEDKKPWPTFEEVTAIAQQLAAVKTPAIAMRLIQQHGAPKLAQLAKEKYPAFMAAAEVLINSEQVSATEL